MHLAKLEGDVAGAVFFTRDPKKALKRRLIRDYLSQPSHVSHLLPRNQMLDDDKLEEDYLDLKDELNPTTRRLAEVMDTPITPVNEDANHIPMQSVGFGSSKDQASYGVFRVSRKRFKRGLRKSARIAKHMIGMLGEADGKKWFLAKAFIGFEVVLSGGVGPVTLKGKPSIELRFNRRT